MVTLNRSRIRKNSGDSVPSCAFMGIRSCCIVWRTGKRRSAGEFIPPELPESLLELNDLTYRLYSQGAINPYGYVYEYLLSPEYFPRYGANTVQVTLAQRDRMIDIPFEMYDVDLTIDYLPHRSFRREPIDY